MMTSDRYQPVEGCPFCLITLGRQKVEGFRWLRSGVMSFIPLNPVTPGHRLVVPTLHVENAGTDPDITARVMEAAGLLVRDTMASANIITSIGEPATQSVFHFHVHVLPRRFGDGLKLPWSDQQSSHPSASASTERAHMPERVVWVCDECGAEQGSSPGTCPNCGSRSASEVRLPGESTGSTRTCDCGCHKTGHERAIPHKGPWKCCEQAVMADDDAGTEHTESPFTLTERDRWAWELGFKAASDSAGTATERAQLADLSTCEYCGYASVKCRKVLWPQEKKCCPDCSCGNPEYHRGWQDGRRSVTDAPAVTERAQIPATAWYDDPPSGAAVIECKTVYQTVRDEGSNHEAALHQALVQMWDAARRDLRSADSAETPDALREEVERLLDAIADLGIDTVNGPWPNDEMGDCGRAASAVRAILQAGDKASVETEDQR